MTSWTARLSPRSARWLHSLNRSSALEFRDMGVISVETFFLPLDNAKRFCISTIPSNGVEPRGSVLYLPPFAEEMNKSRRMAALQARAFARIGWNVLQMDLFGCGDSSGEF